MDIDEESIQMNPPKSSRLSAFGLFDPNPKEIGAALTRLVSETTECLEEVWNEVGYSSEEKSRQLEELLEQIRNLCETKIGQEQVMRDHFADTIRERRSEICDLSQALQIEVDQEIINSPTRSRLKLSDQLAELEDKVLVLKEKASQVTARLEELQGEILAYCQTLGHDFEDDFKDVTSDLTEDRVKAFEAYRERSQKDVEERKAEVGELVSTLQFEMSELRLVPDNELDNQIQGSLERTSQPVLRTTEVSPSSVGISDEWVLKLQNRLHELREEKERRKVILLDVGSKINKLWERLKIAESERQEFQERVATERLGLQNIEEGKKELARLEALKQERLGSLIEDSRNEIRDLWESMSMSQAECEDFAPMLVGTDGFTDDLLAAHEAECQRLKQRLEKMEPLFKMIERREDYLISRMEVDKIQNDSSRLMGRSRGAHEQLKKLSKLEGDKKKIPKLTEHLTTKLLEWEKLEGPFLFQGQRYIDTMKVQEREYEQYREGKKAERLKKRETPKSEATASQGPTGASGNLVPRSKSSKKLGPKRTLGLSPALGPSTSCSKKTPKGTPNTRIPVPSVTPKFKQNAAAPKVSEKTETSANNDEVAVMQKPDDDSMATDSNTHNEMLPPPPLQPVDVENIASAPTSVEVGMKRRSSELSLESEEDQENQVC